MCIHIGNIYIYIYHTCTISFTAEFPTKQIHLRRQVVAEVEAQEAQMQRPLLAAKIPAAEREREEEQKGNMDTRLFDSIIYRYLYYFVFCACLCNLFISM